MPGLNSVTTLFALVLFMAGHRVYASSHEVVLPPLGADPCTWGPAFWCENEANMKRCGVTKEECEKYANDL
ncbi:hypothetical protein NW762_001525 [Fusarium torreyae]|uniref:Saposin A-type domain-containing protein n=1 Tax=Fusarium torreyae TaxID=1237075 RepID=A0A9W8VLB3_9HYPO|nr:hypothetical protein NW762_001525 [Fusarium torreyae]